MTNPNQTDTLEGRLWELAERYFTESFDAMPMLRAAARLGSEDMRERAAKLFECEGNNHQRGMPRSHCEACEDADAIRALNLGGEGK